MRLPTDESDPDHLPAALASAIQAGEVELVQAEALETYMQTDKEYNLDSSTSPSPSVDGLVHFLNGVDEASKDVDLLMGLLDDNYTYTPDNLPMPPLEIARSVAAVTDQAISSI